MSGIDVYIKAGLPLRRKGDGTIDGRHFQGPRKPNPKNNKYRRVLGVRAHRLIVEARTGIKLPASAIVHHVDPNDKLSNEGLFVVCPDQAYHALIERRGRALRECGHVDWMKCYRCLRWDDTKNLILATRTRVVGELDAVHAKHHGVCVDLAEPLPIDAGRCVGAPAGRHTLNTRKTWGSRRVGHSEAHCHYCRKRVIRTHADSVRWYATERQS